MEILQVLKATSINEIQRMFLFCRKQRTSLLGLCRGAKIVGYHPALIPKFLAQPSHLILFLLFLFGAMEKNYAEHISTTDTTEETSSSIIFTTDLSDKQFCQGISNTLTVSTDRACYFKWQSNTANVDMGWQDITDTVSSNENKTSTLNIISPVSGILYYRVIAEPSENTSDSSRMSMPAKVTTFTIPSVPLIAPILPICEGLSTSLTASPVDGSAYEWKGGINATIPIVGTGNVIPAYIPLAAGTEKIMVRYQKNACWSPWSTQTDLLINPKIIPGIITVEKREVCSGITTNISSSASGGTPPLKFQWKALNPIAQTTAIVNSYLPPSNSSAAYSRDTISLTVTDAKGCKASRTSTVSPIPPSVIYILPLPRIDTIIAIGPLACDGFAPEKPFMISPYPTINNGQLAPPLVLTFYYQWKKGDTTILGANSLEYNPGKVSMADNNRKYSVTVTAQITYGDAVCYTSRSTRTSNFATLVVKPLPEAGKILGDTICAGAMSILRSSGASSLSPPLNYTFKIGDTLGGIASTLVGTKNQYVTEASSKPLAVSGIYNIAVDVKDANGCVKTAKNTLMVRKLPILSTIAVKNTITGKSTLVENIKKGIEYEFSTSRVSGGNTGGDYIYSWSHSAQDFANYADTVKFNATSKKNFTPIRNISQIISVYVEDSNKCVSNPAEVLKFIPSNPLPLNLNFGNPLILCLDSAAEGSTFLKLTSEVACNYVWKMSADDGLTWNSVPGAVTVDMNMASILTITNPLEGTYKYRVEAIPMVDGYIGDSMEQELKVYNQPPAPILTSQVGNIYKTEFCQNTEIDFIADISLFDTNSFTWMSDKEPFVINEPTNELRAYIPKDTGLYVMQAEYIRKTCLSAKGSVTINVNRAITNGIITFNPISPACAGDSVQVGANIRGGNSPYTFIWKINDDEIAQTLDTFVFKTSVDPLITEDEITFKVSDSKGCKWELSESAKLDINPIPILGVNMVQTPDTSELCRGTDIMFKAIAYGGDTYAYTWMKNDSILLDSPIYFGTDTANLLIKNPGVAQSGIYEVRINGSKLNCKAATSVKASGSLINIHPLPIVNSLMSTSVYENTESIFTAVVTEGTAPFTYEFYVNGLSRYISLDQNSIPVRVNFADSGKPLIVKVTDAKGCTTISDTNILTVFDKIEILSEAKDAQICQDGDTSFIIKVNYKPVEIKWQWRKGNDNSWIDLVDNDEYDTSYTDDHQIILKVKATVEKNRYQYRCLLNENGPIENRITSLTYTLWVDRSVKFVSNGIITYGDTVVLDMDGSENTTLIAPELLYEIPKPHYQWEKKHAGFDIDFVAGEAEVNAIVFSPTDTGHYAHRCIVSNYCGTDTAKASLLVIRKIHTETMLMRVTTPKGMREDSVATYSQGESFAFEICENNTLALFSPLTNSEAIVMSDVWQYSAPSAPDVWINVISGKSMRIENDTLIVREINISHSGFKFRHIKTGIVDRTSDTSATIRIVVSANTSLRPKLKDFPDMLSVNEDLMLRADLGIEVEEAFERGTYTYHWYEIDKMDAIHFLGITKTPHFILKNISLSKDSVHYFFEVENLCSTKISSDTLRLRVNPVFRLDGFTYFEDINGNKDTSMRFFFEGDTSLLTLCENQYLVLKPKFKGVQLPIAYYFNVDPVLPRDYEPWYIFDSIFTFFVTKDLDKIEIRMRDALGNESFALLNLVVRTAPTVTISLTPKMKDKLYYETQSVLFKAEPGNYRSYEFFKMEHGDLVDKNEDITEPFYKTSFQKHQKNEIYLWVKDAYACRGETSMEIDVRALPNVLIPNDPIAVENRIIFPDYDVEVFDSWGLLVQKMGVKKGWDGKNMHGKQLENGTYYYNVKLPAEGGQTSFISGAITIIVE